MDSELRLAGEDGTILPKDINRRLSTQNNRVSSNWEKLRSRFDKLQLSQKNKIENNKSDVYKYQEKLQGTTGTLTSTGNSTNPGLLSRRQMSLSSVCEDVTKPLENRSEENGEVQPRRIRSFSESFSKGTVSSMQKRLLRRRSSVSLFELQKVNKILSSRPKDVVNQQKNVEAFAEEPAEERENCQDEEVPIRVPPSVYLPPIHAQQVTQLRKRSFERDREFRRKIASQGADPDELKYCRYLRLPRRRRRSIADFRLQK